MIKKLINNRIICFSPFFLSDNPYDRIQTNEDATSDINETGFQRLQNLYKALYNEPTHPALITIAQTSITSLIAGGIYGGIKTSRFTFINFIENNEATQFRNHYDAKRILSDKMFTSFVKGFSTNGFKISFFCTSFITAYTLITVYRNKDSPLNHGAAGSIAGALYKFPLGPKGMISGAVVGGVLGTIYGAFRWILLTISNLTEDQLRQKTLESKIAREETISKIFKESRQRDAEKEILQAMKTN